MRVIENIEALRQQTPNLNAAIYVMGTSGIGDGGGGIYVFEQNNAGPDNGSTVIASDVNGSGYWVLQVGNAAGGGETNPFVVATADASLPQSRVLTAGNNVTVTDNGPGSTIVIASTGGISTASLPLVITASNIALGTAAIPTTNDANADVIWSSSATTRKALVLQGLASQTANVFEVQSSTGVNVFCVDIPSSIVTGTNNNISGLGAGAALTSGSSNCLYGLNSGSTISTGGSNAFFGASTTAAANSTQNAVAVGTLSTAHDFCVVLGATSASTAANQFVAGNANGVNDVYFGKGVVSSTATAYTINGTGGSGTDNAGAALQLAGGKGTGAAEPGLVVLKYPLKTSTGTTLQSLSTQNYVVGGTLFTGNTTNVTVTASVVGTTETTMLDAGFGSKSIEAGLLRAGRSIRVFASGVFTTSATPPTYTVRLKLGSVTVCATTAMTLRVNSGDLEWVLDWVIVTRSIGASGALAGGGFFGASIDGVTASGLALFNFTNTTISAVNTTTANTVDLTVQFSANTAANSITCSVCTVEVMN